MPTDPSARRLPAIDFPAPARSARYYHPELDALRFLAFMLVFLTHVGPGFGRFNQSMIPISFAGAFGVPLFFTLSSFLITELLLRERERTATINVRAFLMRRILRIWPLYFTFLLFGIVYTRIQGYHLPGLLFLSYLTLSGNWYCAFHGFPAQFISPLWSISIEEQFYLVWPSCARLGGRKGLLVLAVFCWLLFLPTLALLGPVNFLRTWADSFIQFQFFGLGAIIAMAIHGRILRFNRLARGAMLVAGLLSFYGAALYIIPRPNGFSSFPPGYLLLQLGCLSLLIGIYDWPEPTGLLRQPFRLFVWLGRISYGLYVFHMLSLHIVDRIANHIRNGEPVPSLLGVFSQDVIALLATILLAALSYTFLEKPFLRYKQHFTVIRSRPA